MKESILLVFALLLVQTVVSEHEVSGRFKRFSEGAAHLLAELMTSGATLADQTVAQLMNNEFSVSVGIEIENFSKWIMMRPKVYLTNGVLNSPPRPISPLKREGMAAHKSPFSLTGSFGSVSWLLGDERLIVMWSVPYNQDWYSNWLAIGIKNNHTKEDTQMMLREEMQWFRKMAYYYDSQTLVYESGKVIVAAQMGTSHKPVARIQIYAQNWEDLPEKAKNQIRKEDYRYIVSKEKVYLSRLRKNKVYS